MIRILLSLLLAGSAFGNTFAVSERPQTSVSAIVEQPPRQPKLDRKVGHAYKRGVRIPGEVVLGQRTWTREGRMQSIESLTSDDAGWVSEERTSYVVGLLRGHPARRTTTFTYDASGRLTEETKTAFGASYRTVYEYNESGIRTGAALYDGGKPSGSSTVSFDDRDSLTSQSEYDRNHVLLANVTVTYDATHHRSTETRSIYGVGGKLQSETVRRFAYDDRGRLTEVLAETDGIQTGIRRYAYTGENPKPSALSEGGSTWKYVYNKDGQLVLESEFYAGNPRGYRRFEYDDQGSLIRETSYNSADQLIDEIVHTIEYW